MSTDAAVPVVHHKHHFSLSPMKFARKLVHLVSSLVPNNAKQKAAAAGPAVAPQPAQGAHVTRTSPIAETNFTKDVLTAATKQAWGPTDPGPSRTIHNCDLGSGTNLSRSVSRDSLIEGYAEPGSPSSPSPSVGANSFRSGYAEPSGAGSPGDHSLSIQTRSTATRVYSSTSQGASPSPQSYFDWAKQYWSMSKDPTKSDLERVGAHTKAKDAAEYAAVLGIQGAANLAWEINKNGLSDLKNPSLNVDVNGEKTRFWFNVVGALGIINKDLASQSNSEQSLRRLLDINKHDPRMSPSMVAARFIIISGATIHPDASIFRDSAQSWMHHFTTAVSTKEFPHEAIREFNSAQALLKHRNHLPQRL